MITSRRLSCQCGGVNVGCVNERENGTLFCTQCISFASCSGGNCTCDCSGCQVKYPEDYIQYPEPNALVDAINHPLWQAMRNSCVQAQSSVQQAFLMNGSMGCSSSCMIVISSQGRIVYQHRRQGYQLFGGGKYPMSILWLVHQVRREQWMESNFDVSSNPAVLSLSDPILIMQTSWNACLVQICIIDDDALLISEDGIVSIGECQLWSREVARDSQYFYELSPNPTAAHMQAGQFFYDSPIIRVCHYLEVAQNHNHWRSCDWISLSLLMPRFRFTLGQSSAQQIADVNASYLPSCLFFGDVQHQDYFRELIAHLCSMQGICKSFWPLLTTSKLYTTWNDEDWCAAACRSA